MSDLLTHEATDLENMLEEECACESTHGDPENKVCTVTVFARATDCQGVLLVCEANYRYILTRMSDGWANWTQCYFCNQKCVDCWKVYPV